MLGLQNMKEAIVYGWNRQEVVQRLVCYVKGMTVRETLSVGRGKIKKEFEG